MFLGTLIGVEEDGAGSSTFGFSLVVVGASEI